MSRLALMRRLASDMWRAARGKPTYAQRHEILLTQAREVLEQLQNGSRNESKNAALARAAIRFIDSQLSLEI